MKNLLLPYWWKLAGIVLAGAGTISALLYTIFDFRFKIPVFAVYSSYLETKYFTTIRTNFAEELTLLLLIAGLSLMIFSKEKEEFAGLDAIRFKSLAKAVLVNNLFLFFSSLFVFGTGYITILVLNVISLLLLYLLFFYLGKRKLKA
jgi:hypothetical protein